MADRLPEVYPAAEQHPSFHCWTRENTRGWPGWTGRWWDAYEAMPRVAIIDHVMVGWIGYLDEMAARREGMDGGRRISVTFAVARDGRVHQYVPITGCGWGNGKVTNTGWPLYPSLGTRPDTGNVNGNIGTISIEHEGSGRETESIPAYSPSNPWPEPLVEATAALHEWLFAEGVIAGRPRAGWTISDHRDLAPGAKPMDPGPEWDRKVRPLLEQRCLDRIAPPKPADADPKAAIDAALGDAAAALERARNALRGL